MAKMQPLPDGITIEELMTYSRSRAFRQVARILNNGDVVSASDLANITGMSIGSMWGVLNELKRLRLIYVSHWGKPAANGTTHTAMYKMGNLPDVPKPAPISISEKRMRRQKVKEEAEKALQESPLFNELAQALVPRRTPEQVAEINRLYLNWISEGTYG